MARLSGMELHQRAEPLPHVRTRVGVRRRLGTDALHSLDQERQVPSVRETDVLLVNRGDAPICATGCGNPGWRTCCRRYTRRYRSGLSAGSMVMTPRSARTSSSGSRPAVASEPSDSSTSRSARTWLTEGVPGNPKAEAERWAAGIDGPAYAIDDETAIQVVDGTVEVVSEGNWRLFAPSRGQAERARSSNAPLGCASVRDVA